MSFLALQSKFSVKANPKWHHQKNCSIKRAAQLQLCAVISARFRFCEVHFRAVRFSAAQHINEVGV